MNLPKYVKVFCDEFPASAAAVAEEKTRDHFFDTELSKVAMNFLMHADEQVLSYLNKRRYSIIKLKMLRNFRAMPNESAI